MLLLLRAEASMFQRTKTIWRQLVGQAPGADTLVVDGSPEERRAWVRFRANFATALKPAGAPDSSRLPAQIRNISLCGINLRVSRGFQPGEMVSIELPGANGKACCDILACVVHCEESLETEWLLGCTFSRPLSAADLDAVRDNPERGDLEDQRECERFEANVNATIQLAAAEELSGFPARVLNISVSGVGLLVDRAIENGTLLNVELNTKAGTVEHTMLACVVYVNRKSETEWALGCNFIRSLDEHDLKELVSG
jgi:PilZ domain